MVYALGLDIGGTKIAAGLIDETGRVHSRYEVPSCTSDAESMFACVVDLVKSVLKEGVEIVGIGAGVPGKVDRENGIAVFQNNLPWANFPFVDRMKEHFDVPIVIDNDVYAAAFAEYCDANVAKNTTFTYVTISTGISSASLIDGVFVRGNGFAGEIGFLPVQDGLSLEQSASGPAIERLAKKAYNDDTITTKDVFERYHTNDAIAHVLVSNAAKQIAQALYSLSCVLDTQYIAFGGSVALKNAFFVTEIKQYLAQWLVAEQSHVLEHCKVSTLGNDVGLIGAGLLALKK